MKNQYLIPLSILTAGMFIVSAILFGGSGGSGEAGNAGNQANLHGEAGVPNAPTPVTNVGLRLVSADDHIRGNPNAEVAIIEYSDFQCPFCKRLHPTIARIVDEQPNKLKWVYRHFPLSSHSKAFEAATASECIAKLGGNEAFWKFTDSMFDDQSKIGKKFYNQLATSLSISTDEFESCLKSSEARKDVNADLTEVTSIGGRGTPHTVVITASGKTISFSGALPYDQIKQIVNSALIN